jgi:GH15 family glucan-1,4-alpha-glucosidase
VIDDLCHTWNMPDDGIWEPRGKRRHNVHSKMMCWLAFDRGSRIAPRFGDRDAATRWTNMASLIHDDVLKNGVDPSGNYFRAAYCTDSSDAALLTLPLHGFFEGNHPLIIKTVQRVRDELCSGPYVYRYRADDGVGGEEGAFVLCGFWLAEALAMTGDLEAAQEIFTAHVQSSNHLGLLAEQIDPITREQLGNFPQAFSHLGLITAAARIDLALRMRDEGLRDVPHLLHRIKTSRD